MEYRLYGNIDRTKSVSYNILKNRGIEDPYRYLNTSEADLNDPLLLDNLKEGVQMLLRHIENSSESLVGVD